jgi:AAA+ ATPase superfamily predicted ATPase
MEEIDSKIVGREDEQHQFHRVLDSHEAEFVAVYGRRRVGKTYLIRKFFESKPCLLFHASGVQNRPQESQLSAFKREIETTFYGNVRKGFLGEPKNWMDALSLLTEAINLNKDPQKIILFLDELPWMATHKSGLLSALDYYWNRFWVNNPRIKLIICGSAASWIIENILNNKGGLHNRVTLRVRLEPFTLKETEMYLNYRGITLIKPQILELYMCIGGIPYYLKMVEKGLSVVQNINKMCFQKRGTLFDEFNNLFSSLFDHSEVHEEIIKVISSKREGMERSEIERLVQTKGGHVTKYLSELEEAGFITAFLPQGRERGLYYKIIDEYTLFYLTWIAPRTKKRLREEGTSHYWETVSQSSAWKSWCGYAFEAVCYKHLTAIRKALKIPDGSSATTWRYFPKKGIIGDEGAQIDLLFDRPDGVVSLCEIKYCKEPFVIDKQVAQELFRKVKIYEKVTKTNKQIFVSMITACRLKKNLYESEAIASEAGVKDLFC